MKMLVALTRAVSRRIGECELTFIDRQAIDYSRAVQQHGNINSSCATWEPRLLSCPAMIGVPIAVFWKIRRWFWMK